MAASLEELMKQARALPWRERAALARTLLADLGAEADADAERLWIKEAQQRYDAYAAGQLPALPGDEVMDRARNRLR